MPVNCSVTRMAVPLVRVPTSPQWEYREDEHLGVGMDKHGLVPVLTVTWNLKSDGK